MNKLLGLLAVGLLVVASLAACGAEPVVMGDVPVYPGTEALPPGENDMADQMANLIRESAGGEGLVTDVNLYTLPAEASWDDVRGFYEGELEGTDWEPAPELAQESEVFNSVGWSRGGGANEQALVVGYVADPFGESAFLILGLFSE